MITYLYLLAFSFYLFNVGILIATIFAIQKINSKQAEINALVGSIIIKKEVLDGHAMGTARFRKTKKSRVGFKKTA